MLFLTLVTSAQQQVQHSRKQSFGLIRSKAVRNLGPGDNVPDIFIPRIINYKYSKAKISDFKDRLLILDFWDTYCSGCVAALPRMEALQEQFGDSITILPVTYQKEALVRAFLKKNIHTKDLIIPSVVEDTILSAWFKHVYIPHEVWIYKGKVIAQTLSDYVDSDNIRFVLAGKKNNWPVKNDFLPPFDYNKPLLRLDSMQFPEQNGFLKYAAMFGYREGAGAKQGTTYDTIHHTRRDYFTNNTILLAYYNYWHKIRDPYGKSPVVFPDANRVILEVRDPEKYSTDSEPRYLADWEREKLFCYESVSPDTGQSIQEQSKAVINDLNHLLNVEGRYEKRAIKCLVLIRTTTEDKLKSAGGDRVEILDQPVKKMNNVPLSTIIRKLNQYAVNPPVLDETSYKDAVDMELKIDSWTDIPALRNALKPYGLDLKEEERVLEVFVLTEKK